MYIGGIRTFHNRAEAGVVQPPPWTLKAREAVKKRRFNAQPLTPCLLGSIVQSTGDAHGHAPPFRPTITFLTSRHRNKADRFINRRGIIGLVGFADPDLPIRVPLGRFWVGLMAEIPARKNFKNTKATKTSQVSLEPREKLLGRADLVF